MICSFVVFKKSAFNELILNGKTVYHVINFKLIVYVLQKIGFIWFRLSYKKEL